MNPFFENATSQIYSGVPYICME